MLPYEPVARLAWLQPPPSSLPWSCLRGRQGRHAAGVSQRLAWEVEQKRRMEAAASSLSDSAVRSGAPNSCLRERTQQRRPLGRWRARSARASSARRHIRAQMAAPSANIRFKFHAMVTSFHSPRTPSSPRNKNWRNPSTDLMMPNTGSGVCLRNA